MSSRRSAMKPSEGENVAKMSKKDKILYQEIYQ